MGEGLGATYRISGDAILRAPKGEMIEHHYIHDLYLQVAFRLGIPALLILLVLLWTYFRRSIANLRISNLSPENSALMAGLVAAMFGEVLLSLTSPTLLNHPTAGVIGCIMALTTAALRRSDVCRYRLRAEQDLVAASVVYDDSAPGGKANDLKFPGRRACRSRLQESPR